MDIQYITDEQGRKTAVIVPLSEWNVLLEKVKAYEEGTELLTSEDEAHRKRAFEELERGEALDLKEAMEEW